ncbi:MAG: LysM peptidoglycan-binding domain-containing protein [Sterolibacterium sp.]|nr:LysM peptidoglycan-binding domain-containing protein [Sterolibacterium sp.]
MTAKTRIISGLLLAYSSLALGLAAPAALAQTSEATAVRQDNVLALAENAPDRHVVVKGDTLWGISGIFLKQPWRWPEIWRLNKSQIKDPHWIYPGQIVYLDRTGAQPRLRIGTPVDSGPLKLSPKVHAVDNQIAISSIPQSIIEPFLTQPLVVEKGALDSAPRIVATQENRVVVGTGDLAYVTGLQSKQPNWQIYRPGKALVDPEDGQVLGHEAFYLGSARLVREGEPATVEIARVAQEIMRDDRLVPAPQPELINYVPHAPEVQIKSRVISVYGAVSEGAGYSIVTLSRGAMDGLEVGHVLALSRAGAQLSNRFQDQQETYQLPDERYGLVFVFRVFEHVAYALVMNVNRPVVSGDLAATP